MALFYHTLLPTPNMINENKKRNLEREAWYEYVINDIPKGVSNEIKKDYLRGVKRGIRTNYNLPLDERIKYLKIVKGKIKGLDC